MGTTINAFIEYDDEARYAFDTGTLPSLTDPPFESDVESVAWDGLCWDKEYDFFAAIAGVRNESGIRPLYAPRGLPASLSAAAERELLDKRSGEPFGHTAGWLHHSEILAAIEHMSMSSEQMGLRVMLMLEIMAYLSRCLGGERVRLVWTFD